MAYNAMITRKCRACSGSNIKTQVNYTHGRNSKPKRVVMCTACGSTDIMQSRGRRR